MTREEAALVLEALYGDWDPLDENNWQALRKAVAALREYDAMAQELKERRVVMPILAKRERELLAELNKEPDPETGLVPCGCGGIAELHEDVNRCYWVDCPKCEIQLGYREHGDDREPRGKFWSKTLVRYMWNCAMGYLRR